MKKPNILFFFTDQQRYDTLGCNGQKLNISPYIDAFAKEAVRFTNAYTPQPVCGPARACLQTGLYPTELGCYRNAISLPVGQNTLAKVLSRNGYTTGYVGKWHLASDKGVNDYKTLPVPVERRGGYKDFWMASDVLEFTSDGYGGFVYDKDNNKVEFKGYRADCITDYGLDFLEQYNDEKPFFLFISHIEPHHQNNHEQYEGPRGSREKYKDFPVPPDLEGNEGDWEKVYPDYLGCCHALDHNFGKLVQKLRDKGIYEDTMIIYTSDHGCHFKTHQGEVLPGGHDDYKRNCFDNTIHIPLLIKGAGFEKGIAEHEMVSLIDLPKTILRAAGCDEEFTAHGEALQDIHNTKSWKKHIYIQISESFVGRAIRTKKYKYCVYAPDKHPINDMRSDEYKEKYLFDLEKDPFEKKNLIQDPHYAVIKRELALLLKRSAEEAGEGYINICHT